MSHANGNLVKKSATRRRISRLVLAGLSQTEIAEKTGHSESTVREHCDELFQRWMTDSDTDYRQRLAQELARLQRIENEAWAAWRRSKGPAQSVQKVYAKVPVEGASPDDLFAEPAELKCVQEIHNERGQCGDPRFLTIAKECTQERLRLMGAYKDIAITANFLEVNQVVAFANQLISVVERAGVEPQRIEAIKAGVLQMMPGAPIQVQTEEVDEPIV